MKTKMPCIGKSSKVFCFSNSIVACSFLFHKSVSLFLVFFLAVVCLFFFFFNIIIMWKIVRLPKFIWQALMRSTKSPRFRFYSIYINIYYMKLKIRTKRKKKKKNLEMHNIKILQHNQSS